MEQYNSGEELVIKPRKPYTITKQRERWTEEEHNRFLEALKLYGRAWQRIEEHIGTKTAVQIRSHAQKFFTKLEKEAVVKGVSTGQTVEIEIPPPRPKRKPSNPYPRKTSVVGTTPTLQVPGKDAKSVAASVSSSSLQATSHPLDLEKEPPPERPSCDEKLDNPNKKLDEDNSSEVFSSFQEATCGSLSSSANKNSVRPVAPRNVCAFKERVPILKEVTTNQDETNESYLTVEPPKGNQKLDKPDDAKNIYHDDNSTTFKRTSSNLLREKSDEQTKPDNIQAAAASSHNYPRHVPVHVVDGKQGMNKQNVPPEMAYQLGQVHGVFANMPAAAAAASVTTTTEAHSVSISSVHHQSVPTFNPFFSNHHDDYHHFLHSISSTFSSLVLSALLQNPAAHAAATIAAATLYPTTPCAANLEAAGDFQTNSAAAATPSMTALAAATVSAATAWWAAHGLLPTCSPFDAAAFTGNLVSNAAPCHHETQAAAAAAAAVASDRKGQVAPDPTLQNQESDPQGSEALGEQNSSDSERSEDRKQLNTGMVTDDAEPVQSAAAAAAETELHDTNKTKSRKQVDRSSCGSNTASSSEVETDALGKDEKGKEECQEPDAATNTNITTTSSDSNRRGRIPSTNLNDSWKEVSQGGRLAFQALFSRERLPQSFSPPYDLNNEGQQKHETEKDNQCIGENGLQLDLNSKVWGDCTAAGHNNNNSNSNNNSLVWKSEKSEGAKEEGMLTMKMMMMKGLHNHHHNHHRTAGFKPYKRCSVEAIKESRVVGSTTGGGNNPDEEKNSSKRMRLEGGASA